MGDDAVDSMLYAINRETGEEFVVGKEITEIPKLAPGGIINEPLFYECDEPEMVISLKTIKKKRFIKLLMSRGFQKNYAIKMHEKYMEDHKTRTRLGLELFVAMWNSKPEEFKILVGGLDINGKTNNM